jgi:hypothetical protein
MQGDMARELYFIDQGRVQVIRARARGRVWAVSGYRADDLVEANPMTRTL